MMAARLRNATRRRSHGSFVRGNNFLEEQTAGTGTFKLFIDSQKSSMSLSFFLAYS